MRRRAGTQDDAECTMGPGSAAHRFALRSIRGTPHPEVRAPVGRASKDDICARDPSFEARKRAHFRMTSVRVLTLLDQIVLEDRHLELK